MNTLVDTVIIFRILRKLTTAWDNTSAFKKGIIDKNGNLLVRVKDMTADQKQSYTLLDRLVFNLKRMINKVPGGTSNLSSYVAALGLIREHLENEYNAETASFLIEKMDTHNLIPSPLKKYNLGTQEGFMEAFEDALIEGMSSGAAMGGSLSGSGSNAQVNATGLAGVDRPLFGSKKAKNIQSIINKRT